CSRAPRDGARFRRSCVSVRSSPPLEQRGAGSRKPREASDTAVALRRGLTPIQVRLGGGAAKPSYPSPIEGEGGSRLVAYVTARRACLSPRCRNRPACDRA